MKTIWKYQFPITDRFLLEMPIGAKILTAFIRNKVPCLWAEVETKEYSIPRKFAVTGTGNPTPTEDCCWIATFSMPPFIWHLYELK